MKNKICSSLLGVLALTFCLPAHAKVKGAYGKEAEDLMLALSVLGYNMQSPSTVVEVKDLYCGRRNQGHVLSKEGPFSNFYCAQFISQGQGDKILTRDEGVVNSLISVLLNDFGMHDNDAAMGGWEGWYLDSIKCQMHFSQGTNQVPTYGCMISTTD